MVDCLVVDYLNYSTTLLAVQLHRHSDAASNSNYHLSRGNKRANSRLLDEYGFSKMKQALVLVDHRFQILFYLI